MFSKIIGFFLSLVPQALKDELNYIPAKNELAATEAQLEKLITEGRCLQAELDTARRAPQAGVILQDAKLVEKIENLLSENAGIVSVLRMKGHELAGIIERVDARLSRQQPRTAS